EKLMETVTQGYLRALGEADPERRSQIWSLLGTAEATLYEQFNRFAREFARTDGAETRVGRLPVCIPYLERLLPKLSFDMRDALQIHAAGIERVARNEAGKPPRDKAYTLSAELFLMQHTCHWFCKSRTVASARMLARHKTSYEQLVASVSPATRVVYCELVGRG
ncbi:MAG: hypothetical protein JWP77_1919, partial [Polaromonas sp.]|nr:hypothetical protein [Polaromonas sp.]